MVTSVGTTSNKNFGSTIVNSITGGNIDIQTLADNLTEAEKAPRQSLLDKRKQITESKISSIGKITSAANDFQTSLKGLGDPRTLGYSPQSTNPTAADFSFKSFVSPKPLNLSFVVKQLATQNTVTLPTINSNAALIGTDGADQGTFTIRKLDGTVIDSIDFSGTQKLSDLAAKINANAKANATGLSATIINSAVQPDGSYSQSLVISNGTGSARNFTVDLSFKQANADFSPNTTGLKLNATASFNQSNGVNAIIATGPYTDPTTNTLAFQNTYQSSSNTFSNLVSGVNINVYSTTSDTAPVTLTTEQNTTGLLSALQTLVTGYNNLLTTVQAEAKYNLDVTKRGGLANDSVAKLFISQLRKLTTKEFPDGNGNTFTLSDIGVKTNTADGTLSIDTDKVSRVQQERPELFTAVLTSKTATQSNGSAWVGPTGALEQMSTLNKIVVGTGSDFSLLLDRTKNKDEQSIADDQTKLDNQMTALHTRYLAQFTAMQNILNSTKTDQTSLTNMMTAWSAGLKG